VKADDREELGICRSSRNTKGFVLRTKRRRTGIDKPKVRTKHLSFLLSNWWSEETNAEGNLRSTFLHGQDQGNEKSALWHSLGRKGNKPFIKAARGDGIWLKIVTVQVKKPSHNHASISLTVITWTSLTQYLRRGWKANQSGRGGVCSRECKNGGAPRCRGVAAQIGARQQPTVNLRKSPAFMWDRLGSGDQ